MINFLNSLARFGPDLEHAWEVLPGVRRERELDEAADHNEQLRQLQRALNEQVAGSHNLVEGILDEPGHVHPDIIFPEHQGLVHRRDARAQGVHLRRRLLGRRLRRAALVPLAG